MIVPCKGNPIKGLLDNDQSQQAQIDYLLSQGAIDLSGLAAVDHEHPPIDLSGYVTDQELIDGLAEKSDTGHTHPLSHYRVIYQNTIWGTTAHLTNITNGQSKYVTGLDITWLATSGSRIQFDAVLTLTDSGTAGANLVIYAEVGGAQQPLGQVYHSQAETRISTLSLTTDFTDVWGQVTAKVSLTCIGGTWALHTNDYKPALLRITEYGL